MERSKVDVPPSGRMLQVTMSQGLDTARAFLSAGLYGVLPDIPFRRCLDLDYFFALKKK